MKKLTVLLSLIAMMFCVVPVQVSAADQRYNTEVEFILDEKGEKWHTSQNGGKYIIKKFSVSKTNEAGYVYMAFTEDVNVKIKDVIPGDEFERVGDFVEIEKGEVKGRAYVFKLKNGTSINKNTELAQVVADIVDPSDGNCVLNYSPYDTICSNTNGIYFNDKGEVVTEDQYKEACEGTTPINPSNPDDPNDVPNSQTGSIIPYIAIGGGLLAIAGVYFISRKSNKMYRL